MISSECSNETANLFAERYSRSFDMVRDEEGFLIKVSVLIYEIKRRCGESSVDQVLRLVLMDPRVSRSIIQFAMKKEIIFGIIDSKEHYQDLRPYKSVIADALEKAKEVRAEEDNIVTPCLNIYYIDMLKREFIKWISDVGTIDSKMIKLTTLVDILEEDCKRLKKHVEHALTQILKDDKVIKALAPITSRIEYATYLIRKDPRFKSLRPYNRVLLEALYKAGEEYEEYIPTSSLLRLEEKSRIMPHEYAGEKDKEEDIEIQAYNTKPLITEHDKSPKKEEEKDKKTYIVNIDSRKKLSLIDKILISAIIASTIISVVLFIIILKYLI